MIDVAEAGTYYLSIRERLRSSLMLSMPYFCHRFAFDLALYTDVHLFATLHFSILFYAILCVCVCVCVCVLRFLFFLCVIVYVNVWCFQTEGEPMVVFVNPPSGSSVNPYEDMVLEITFSQPVQQKAGWIKDHDVIYLLEQGSNDMASVHCICCFSLID
jgi:hypothetical protein